MHLALRALRARTEPDQILACELAWEVHTRGYWSQLHGDDGRPYESEEHYFREVLGLASWRTAYKRLAIGRLLTQFTEPERTALRAAVAAVGLAKTAVLVPAIERLGDWTAWMRLGGQLSTVVLQARVTAALQALPRGREPTPPGERFRRSVLASMPDIEAMTVVERFFELGARVVESGHPVAIFLAGCRECLADWEVQVARGRRPGYAGAVDLDSPAGPDAPRPDPTPGGPADLRLWRRCPRGQNGNGHRGPGAHEAVTAAGGGGPSTDTRGRTPSAQSCRGLPHRVGPHSGDRADAGSMHLPGLWGPDRPRSPSRPEAIPGRLRLRPRGARDPVSRVSCADRCPVREGSAGGDPPRRRSLRL